MDSSVCYNETLHVEGFMEDVAPRAEVENTDDISPVYPTSPLLQNGHLTPDLHTPKDDCEISLQPEGVIPERKESQIECEQPDAGKKMGTVVDHNVTENAVSKEDGHSEAATREADCQLTSQVIEGSTTATNFEVEGGEQSGSAEASEKSTAGDSTCLSSEERRTPRTSPCNWNVVEKITPPEITQYMKKLFETGQFKNSPEIKKINPADDLNAAPDSGVYENEPQLLADVVRESDFTSDIEPNVQTGIAKNMASKFKNLNLKDTKGKKTIADHQKDSEDVTHDGDESVVFRTGYTKNLADKFLMSSSSGTPKKKPIQLVETTSEGPVVYENEPEERQDVIKSGIKNWKTEDLTPGHIQNMASYWANYQEETKPDKKPVVIDKEAGPVVLENEPVSLEGVYREDDTDSRAVDLKAGNTRGLASRFLHIEQNDQTTAVTKKPIKLVEDGAEPIILENEPEVLEGVVRSQDSDSSSVNIDTGKTKNLRNMWKNIESEEPDVQEKNRGCGKPAWLKEIEAAREESMKAMQNEDEEGIQCDDEYVPEQTVIPQNKTSNLRAVWDKQDSDQPEIAKPEVNRPGRVLVRPTVKSVEQPKENVGRFRQGRKLAEAAKVPESSQSEDVGKKPKGKIIPPKQQDLKKGSPMRLVQLKSVKGKK